LKLAFFLKEIEGSNSITNQNQYFISFAVYFSLVYKQKYICKKVDVMYDHFPEKLKKYFRVKTSNVNQIKKQGS
jgi:hypothetical protein